MATNKEQFNNDMNALSNAINEKTGGTEPMTISEMIENVKGISGAELNIHYGTTTPSDTTKLWVKRDITPSKVSMTSEVNGEETQMIETLGVTLLEKESEIGCASVGTKIYLFGGMSSSSGSYINTIQVFDTTSNTLTTLSTTLPTATSSIGCAAVDNKVYLFGGYSSGAINTIQVFNTETQTIEILSTTLPTAAYEIGCASVGTKIYLFGGFFPSSRLNTINLFTIIKDLDLSSNNLLLHSKDIGTFKLFNSDTLDIEAKVGDCYYGNSNNKGEQVKIAVYKDSAWSELN